jgi:hypothetical protein
MEVKIVAEQGTHLLIASGDRYAVIERRNGRYYNCHEDKRANVPADDLQGVDRALDARDWTDRQTAQAMFKSVTSRGTDLARCML